MKPARATPALAAGPAAESSSPPSEPSSSVLVGSEPDEVLEPDSSLPSVSVDEGLSVSVSVSVPVVTVSVAVVVPLVGTMVGMVVGASVSVTSESVVASVAETLVLLKSVGNSVAVERMEEISLPMEETAPEQIFWAPERASASSEAEHSEVRQVKEPWRIASKLVQRQVTSVASQPESGRASPMQPAAQSGRSERLWAETMPAATATRGTKLFILMVLCV
jgi:hypothetical protein